MQGFVMKSPGFLLVRSGWSEEITWALALTRVISFLNPKKIVLLCKSSIQEV